MQKAPKEKAYKVVSPDSQQIGLVRVNPNSPAVAEKSFLPLSLMLAHSRGADSLPDGESSLLYLALESYEVTTDEAMKAFWRAYADPYVSQGRIEFRHLWKHISEWRGEKDRTFTYPQMLSEMDKSHLPQDAFEILNGENGRPTEKDSSGKFKWRLRK